MSRMQSRLKVILNVPAFWSNQVRDGAEVLLRTVGLTGSSFVLETISGSMLRSVQGLILAEAERSSQTKVRRREKEADISEAFSKCPQTKDVEICELWALRNIRSHQ